MAGFCRFLVVTFLILNAIALIAGDGPEYDLWQRLGQTVSDDPRRFPGPDLFLGYRDHFEKPTAYVDELRGFIEAGFTPMEAIVAATRTGAEILNMSDKLGTVESGKLADLIMVAGNPLDDIGALAKPVFVMVDGKFID